MFTPYLYESQGIEIALSNSEIDTVFWNAAAPGMPTAGIKDFLLQCTKDYNKNGLPTYNFYRSSKERYFIFLKCNDYMLQLRAKLARRLIS